MKIPCNKVYVLCLLKESSDNRASATFVLMMSRSGGRECEREVHVKDCRLKLQNITIKQYILITLIAHSRQFGEKILTLFFNHSNYYDYICIHIAIFSIFLTLVVSFSLKIFNCCFFRPQRWSSSINIIYEASFSLCRFHCRCVGEICGVEKQQ